MYNFFASHSQWNTNQVKKLVGIDATFVTILRDPVEVFESGYVYFGMEKILERDINQYIKTVRRHPRSKMAIFGKNQLLYDLGKQKNILHHYILKPNHFCKHKIKDRDLLVEPYRSPLFVILQFILFLGIDSYDMESKSKVAERIRKIDSDFHLVLLVEQMEESLILMKELLCWDLIDIRYFKLNERSEETKKSQMTSKTRDRSQYKSLDSKLLPLSGIGLESNKKFYL